MGFADVDAFRASGNIVFTVAPESAAELTERIEGELARLLGYQVITFLRSADEVRAIAEHEPFDPAPAGGKLQVALLARRPTPSARRDALALATDEDAIALGDRELYWLPRAGTLDSPLDMRAIEKLLGVMTFRTKNTLERIAGKYFAD